MMRLMGLCLVLAACAHTPEPRVITRDVLMPVPVQCRPDLGPEPAYPDTPAALSAAPDIFAVAKLYVAGRLMRIARLEEQAVALKVCAG